MYALFSCDFYNNNNNMFPLGWDLVNKVFDINNVPKVQGFTRVLHLVKIQYPRYLLAPVATVVAYD